MVTVRRSRAGISRAHIHKEQEPCDTTMSAASAAHQAGGSPQKMASDAAGTATARNGTAAGAAVAAPAAPSAARSADQASLADQASRVDPRCTATAHGAVSAVCAGHGPGAETYGPRHSR